MTPVCRQGRIRRGQVEAMGCGWGPSLLVSKAGKGTLNNSRAYFAALGRTFSSELIVTQYPATCFREEKNIFATGFIAHEEV